MLTIPQLPVPHPTSEHSLNVADDIIAPDSPLKTLSLIDLEAYWHISNTASLTNTTASLDVESSRFYTEMIPISGAPNQPIPVSDDSDDGKRDDNVPFMLSAYMHRTAAGVPPLLMRLRSRPSSIILRLRRRYGRNARIEHVAVIANDSYDLLADD